MKRYYFNILLLLSSAFYIGCTNTYFVATHSLQTQRDTITINQLQEKLQDKTVKIILRDNQQIQAENIRFFKDTATFAILPDLKQISFPLVAIKKIERRLHFEGTFVGAFFGLLCAPIAIAIFSKLSPNKSNDSWSAGFDNIGYGLELSFSAGVLYGGIRGNIEEYIFDSDIDKHAP